MLDGGRDLEVSSFFVNHEFVILHKGDYFGKIMLRNIFLRIKMHISTCFYVFASGILFHLHWIPAVTKISKRLPNSKSYLDLGIQEITLLEVNHIIYISA